MRVELLPTSPGGAGATDHGALTGLTDDDHAHYLLATGLREWDEQGTDPTTPASGKWALYFKAGGLYYVDDAGAVTGPLGTGGGGSSTFLGLTDTPGSFSGLGLDLVRVNAGETALEAVDLGSIDHGSLGGQADDDHTQYVLATGLREWSEQGTDPTTPASGNWSLYFKAGGLYVQDDAGTVYGPIERPLELDESPSDGEYEGFTIEGTAGATLAFGNLCYLAAGDSRWEKADASAAATAGDVVLALCVLAAAADGDPTRMLLVGIIRADSAFPTLTVGAPVYAGETAGEVVVAKPTTTDAVVRCLGHALDANTMHFRPDGAYITHA